MRFHGVLTLIAFGLLVIAPIALAGAPDPRIITIIEADEVERIADDLRVSNGQFYALTEFYAHYRDLAKQLRESALPDISERPDRISEYKQVLRHQMLIFDARRSAMKTLDDSFFANIASVLTEEQISRLHAARNRRGRLLASYAAQISGQLQWPIADLSLLATNEIYRPFLGKHDDLMSQYDHQLSSLFSSLDRAAADFEIKLIDETLRLAQDEQLAAMTEQALATAWPIAAQDVIEQMRKINALNRMGIRTIIDDAPVAVKATFVADWLNLGYRDAHQLTLGLKALSRAIHEYEDQAADSNKQLITDGVNGLWQVIYPMIDKVCAYIDENRSIAPKWIVQIDRSQTISTIDGYFVQVSEAIDQFGLNSEVIKLVPALRWRRVYDTAFIAESNGVVDGSQLSARGMGTRNRYLAEILVSQWDLDAISRLFPIGDNEKSAFGMEFLEYRTRIEMKIKTFAISETSDFPHELRTIICDENNVLISRISNMATTAQLKVYLKLLEQAKERASWSGPSNEAEGASKIDAGKFMLDALLDGFSVGKVQEMLYEFHIDSKPLLQERARIGQTFAKKQDGDDVKTLRNRLLELQLAIGRANLDIIRQTAGILQIGDLQERYLRTAFPWIFATEPLVLRDPNQLLAAVEIHDPRRLQLEDILVGYSQRWRELIGKLTTAAAEASGWYMDPRRGKFPLGSADITTTYGNLIDERDALFSVTKLRVSALVPEVFN